MCTCLCVQERVHALRGVTGWLLLDKFEASGALRAVIVELEDQVVARADSDSGGSLPHCKYICKGAAARTSAHTQAASDASGFDGHEPR